MPDLYSVVRDYTVRLWEKDIATFRHSKNVADISVRLSMGAGLSGAERDLLYLSAFFHDVGKIKIDKYLLTKNGISILSYELLLLRLWVSRVPSRLTPA